MYNRNYYSTRTMSWSYVDLQDLTYSSGYYLYFWNDLYNYYELDDGYQHTFDNVTIEETGGGNAGYVYFYGGNYGQWEFTNWRCEDIIRTNYYNVGDLKMENCTFFSNSAEDLWHGCGYSHNNNRYTTSKTRKWGHRSGNQPKIKFVNCTWQSNDGGVYTGGLSTRGTIIMYEDCEWISGQRGIYAQYGSNVLLKGTQTFTSITVANKTWSTNSTYLHVRDLALTIQDHNGQALENASVQIRQSEDKEIWNFFTDSNGQIKDCHGDDIVLVEREETSNAVYTNWSDSISGGRFHRILVAKEGFQSKEYQVEMTADQTITIQLSPVTSANTTPIVF